MKKFFVLLALLAAPVLATAHPPTHNHARKHGHYVVTGRVKHNVTVFSIDVRGGSAPAQIRVSVGGHTYTETVRVHRGSYRSSIRHHCGGKVAIVEVMYYGRGNRPVWVKVGAVRVGH